MFTEQQMKPGRLRILLILAATLIPFLLPIDPVTRFGVPLVVLLYAAVSGRGTIYYILGLRASKKGNEDAVLHCMLKAAGNYRTVSLERGCIAAVTLLKHGKTEEAAILFEHLAEKRLQPAQANALQGYRALLYWKTGEQEEAVAILRNLLEGGYRTSYLYSTLGYFLLHTSTPEEAIALNLEAVDYDDTPDILDNLTAAYISAGMWEEAAEISSRVTAAEPKFAEAWYHAGLIAQHRNDPERAVGYFERSSRAIFSSLSLLTPETVRKALEAAAADTTLPDPEEQP